MRLLAFLYLLALAAIIVTANRGALPGPILAIYALPWGDRVAHALIAMCGAFLCDRALPGRRLGPLPLGSSLLGTVLLLEECSQLVMTHRVASPSDGLMTLLGVILGAWLQSSCSASKKRPVTSLPS